MGISSTLSDTKDAAEALVKLIDIVTSAMQTVTSMIGFKVLLLFLAVILLSSGLAFFGIPRGKASFFISLTIVNLFWIALERSFNTESYDYIFTMLKTNLVLLLPFLILFILSRLLPSIINKTLPKILSFIRAPLFKKKIINKIEIINISEQYQEVSSQFQRSLLRDILHNKNDLIILSNSTLKHKEELEDILKGFPKLIN